MEALNACPHHGFDTWLLVSYFYDGNSPVVKQLLETMYGGDFLSKYKDLGSPTISVNIGGTCVERALLDLGASVNLLPYSLYK